MALIPEDRKTEGLMLPMSVADNLGMAALGSLTRGFLIDRTREREAIQRMVEKLRIKVGNVGDAVATLSGGNQQKVVIAKWLMTDPRLILLNDPTRGIDVGTKQELYQLLRDLADAGAAILLYTTDYDELIGLCDRVLILYDGAVVRELEGARHHRDQHHRQLPQPTCCQSRRRWRTCVTCSCGWARISASASPSCSS